MHGQPRAASDFKAFFIIVSPFCYFHWNLKFLCYQRDNFEFWSHWAMVNPQPVAYDDSIPPNSTAVAIDKDKNSPHAVRWAIDHLVISNPLIVLIHVKHKHGHHNHQHQHQHRRYPFSFIFLLVVNCLITICTVSFSHSNCSCLRLLQRIPMALLMLILMLKCISFSLHSVVIVPEKGYLIYLIRKLISLL